MSVVKDLTKVYDPSVQPKSLQHHGKQMEVAFLWTCCGIKHPQKKVLALAKTRISPCR